MGEIFQENGTKKQKDIALRISDKSRCQTKVNQKRQTETLHPNQGNI